VPPAVRAKSLNKELRQLLKDKADAVLLQEFSQAGKMRGTRNPNSSRNPSPNSRSKLPTLLSLKLIP
jgi:hypothetical protein